MRDEINYLGFSILNKLIQFVDSSTEDESIPEERISTPDKDYNYPLDHIGPVKEAIKVSRDISSGGHHQRNVSERRPQNLPPPVSKNSVLF